MSTAGSYQSAFLRWRCQCCLIVGRVPLRAGAAAPHHQDFAPLGPVSEQGAHASASREGRTDKGSELDLRERSAIDQLH
jgi:hypothetical protein